MRAIWAAALLILISFTVHADPPDSQTEGTYCTNCSQPALKSGNQSLYQQGCEIEMKQAGCDEYFKKNNIPESFRRKCDEGFFGGMLDQIDGLVTCPIGAVKALGANLKRYKDMGSALWTQIEQAQAAAAKQYEMLDLCDKDQTLDCKRELAREGGFDIPDAKLKDLSAHGLYAAKLHHEQLLAKQQAVPQSITPESIKKNQEKLRQAAAATLALISSNYKKLGIITACYTQAKQQELVCYGAGLVLLDPAVLGPAGLVAIKRVAGLVRGAAEVAEAGSAARTAAKAADEARAVQATPEATQAAETTQATDAAPETARAPEAVPQAEHPVDPESLQTSSATRADLANQGELTDLWRRPLSQQENQAITQHFSQDPNGRQAFDQLQSKMLQAVKTQSNVIPSALQDQYMVNLNRAVANLKSGENLDYDLYGGLIDRALKAKPGSAEATAARQALQTETDVLRAINAESGTSLSAKIDGLIARAKLKIKGLKASDLKMFKACTVFPGYAQPGTQMSNTCLAAAAKVIKGAKIRPGMTKDELAREVREASGMAPMTGLTDQSDLVAEAARVDIANRSQAYKNMLKASPDDKDIRSFDTVIIGGGPQTAAGMGKLQGTRTLVLNESDDMGTFAKMGDTFKVNSPPEANNFPTGMVQHEDMARGQDYTAGRVIGNATDVNMALSDADFYIGDRAVAYRIAPEGSPHKYIVETKNGQKFYTDNIVDISGMGEKTFPIKDAATQDLIKKEYESGMSRIRFVDDFLTDSQKIARTGVNPIESTAGKRVVVIGGGDGGAISTEYVFGHGPPAGYAFKTDNLDALHPKVVYWFGQKAKNSTDYKNASWKRYWDLARDFDSKELKPVDARATRIEKITSGPDKGAFKVFYGPGPNDYKVADEVIFAAGYDREAVSSRVAHLAGGNHDGVQTQMIRGNPEGKFPADVNVAKQIVVNGEPQSVYVAGPATGGLDTVGEAGGENSPRIQTLGPRTSQLMQNIRNSITSPRACLTCKEHGISAELNLRPGPAAAEETLKIPARSIRVASEEERETRVRFHMMSLLNGLSLKYGDSLDFYIAPDLKGGFKIISKSVDASGLAKLEEYLNHDPDLMALIGAQGKGVPRGLHVTHFGAGQAGTHDIVEFYDLATQTRAGQVPRILRQALTSSGARSSLMKAVAEEHAPLSELNRQIKRMPGVSAAEKTRMQVELATAYKKADDIRRGYSDLVTLSPKNEGPFIDKVSKLEERGKSREEIREEIKKSEVSCPMH